MNENSITCPSCGAANPAGTAVCSLCGKPLDPVRPQVPPQVPPTGAPFQLPPVEGQYYRPPTTTSQVGNWWDKQAAPYKAGSAAIWFHVICCTCPGVVIGLLLMAFCATQEGKDNGKRLLIYSGIGMLVAIVLKILQLGMAVSTQR